jgi:hypothetical protein
MIRVLHHIAEPDLALRQIRRVMCSGGTFILEFANKQNLKAILRYALRLQKWDPFSPEPVEFAALNFDFHPQTVRGWLVKEGFHIQRQLTVSHFRLGLLKRLIPTRVLVGLDSLAQLTGDWWQLTPSVFVKAKAHGEASGEPAAKEAFFRCPVCRQALPEGAQKAIRCPGCGRVWPIRDGIYDFREY